MPPLDCIRAGAFAVSIALAAGARARQPLLPPVQLPAAASFTVFVKLVPVGSEQIAVRRGTAVFTIDVGESSTEQIQTTERLIVARRTAVRMSSAGAPLDAEVSGDETGHLLRLTIAAQGLDVVREDIASVAARRVTISRTNDESAKILANGFSLAATVSKPADGSAKPLPAAVLVAGSGPTDRDETVFGIPIFG